MRDCVAGPRGPGAVRSEVAPVTSRGSSSGAEVVLGVTGAVLLRGILALVP